MSYLYGDSTASTLEINFIDFLRDAVDFCVQVLAADERIAEGKTRARELESASTADVLKLERIGALIPKALEGAPVGDGDSVAARCVASIVRSAEELVRAAKGEVGAALDAEIKKRDEAEARDREVCLKALETLLIKHDLPEMKTDLHVALVAGGRYVCRMNATTAFGLDAAMELDVPLNHPFEKVVRVDRVMERLEVQVPEMGGWIHKEIRLRPQHLEKHHVVELLLKSGGDRLKLRASPDGKGPGFDVLYEGDGAAPRLVRVDDEEKGVETFDVEEADRPKLLTLRDRLAAATSELAGHRKAVIEAKLEGESLRTHTQPSLVVERLIATLAPEVQEIAARSQSSGELVLRRLLGGDRREEIFLSKQELKVKLEPLKEAHRALFQPLWQSAIRPPTRVAPAWPKVAAVPAPGPTRPSIEPAARAAAMVPTPGPTIPSFEPPSPDAFTTVRDPVPPAMSLVMPPPPPPPRLEAPQQAAGVIEIRDVDVTLEDGPSNQSGPV
jgi:hypothetical protein